MSKTIKELADELGVSKQTIQYHYQRLPAKKRQKDPQGRNVISVDVERFILNKVAKPLPPKTEQKKQQTPPKIDKQNNALIADMKGEIAYLKVDRDRQFAAKDQQIEKLQKLLDQSQQLQLIAEQKLKELAVPQSEMNSDEQPMAQQPTNFWSRLIGNRRSKK